MTTTEIHDELFGHLKWDEQLKWWSDTIDVQNSAIELCLDIYAPADITAIMRESFLRCQQVNFDYRADVAANLLSLYNDKWNNDAPIGVETFASKLTLHSIVVENDGHVRLWHNVGALFEGYDIYAVIRPNGVFDRALLAG